MLSETNRQILQLASLPYRERRLFLFGNHKPPSSTVRKRFLYKYSNTKNLNNLRSIIIDSNLWFSSPSGFNDPFDSSWRTEIKGSTSDIKQKILNIFKANPHGSPVGWKAREKRAFELMRDPKALIDLIKNSSTKNIEESGVLCLTTEPRSILMWSHYSDHHKGLAFQFEFAEDVSLFIQAISVRYLKDYPARDWVNDDNAYLKNALFGKHEDWGYEKEKRILIPNYANRNKSFKPAALTGILLGCKFTEYEWLKAIILERQEKFGGDLLPVYKAIQSEAAYRLSFRLDPNIT